MERRPQEPIRLSLVARGRKLKSERPALGPASRKESIAYLADILRQLERLAATADFATLAAILAVASLEANSQLQKSKGDQQA
jgi:hypothetical protein